MSAGSHGGTGVPTSSGVRSGNGCAGDGLRLSLPFLRRHGWPWGLPPCVWGRAAPLSLRWRVSSAGDAEDARAGGGTGPLRALSPCARSSAGRCRTWLAWGPGLRRGLRARPSPPPPPRPVLPLRPNCLFASRSLISHKQKNNTHHKKKKRERERKPHLQIPENTQETERPQMPYTWRITAALVVTVGMTMHEQKPLRFRLLRQHESLLEARHTPLPLQPGARQWWPFVGQSVPP